MDNVGVIHGRFQMLHNGHMQYLLEGKKRSKYLIIGISNPDVILMKPTKTNPHRSSTTANPLTYYERFQMIKGSMIEAGISPDEFDIVPFPINFSELIHNYVPIDAKYYMTIYDEWSIEKKKILESVGCDIEIMWTSSNDKKITSGTEVRNIIRNNGEWKHLVPKYVYRYVIKNKIDDRIRLL